MHSRRLIIPFALGLMCTTRAGAEDFSLTIYNEGFAAVRGQLHLDLKPGENSVSYSEATAHVEPDSIILRDPSGKVPLTILEQRYRSDTISQGLLLQMNEGKDIDFQVRNADGTLHSVHGTIVRSGYMAPNEGYNQIPQPLIKVDGKLQFSLPGEPIFPALANDAILKPTLSWIISAQQPVALDAEIGYISEGFTWKAAYNVVCKHSDEGILDLTGWVTIDNHSGTSFPHARIKLVGGDVSKYFEPQNRSGYATFYAVNQSGPPPGVTQKPFGDYHLYSLPRSTDLKDQSTVQSVFLTANGIACTKHLVYDGGTIDMSAYQNWNPENMRDQQSVGTNSNPKVWVMRTFSNTIANHLGVPFPAGRIRYYIQDDDGQLEFAGENMIDHTPSDEDIQVYTGNSFDIVGERHQVEYKAQLSETKGNVLDETYSITVRNHSALPTAVTVVEHPFRWKTWEIRANSVPFTKRDGHTIEFPLTIPAKQEQTVTYTAHYTW